MMDEQTKRLVEEAEARASKAIGASWNIPDATYDDFRAHKADMASLCAKVRELDAEVSRMRVAHDAARTALLESLDVLDRAKAALAENEQLRARLREYEPTPSERADQMDRASFAVGG